MAMKDYANSKKKRRNVGLRSGGFNDSDRSLAKIVKANRGRGGRKTSFIFKPMFLLVSLAGAIFLGSIFYIEYFRSLATDFVNSVNSVHPERVAKKSKPLSSDNTNNIATTNSKATNKHIELAASKTPKFEFYHTLPKMVVGADNSAKTSVPSKLEKIEKLEQTPILSKNLDAENKPENKLENKADAGAYFLQIASFRNIKDADALKGKLTLAGFNVIIQTVRLPNGEVWHRVKSNKVANIELALNLHSQLKVHQINAVILTEKSAT